LRVALTSRLKIKIAERGAADAPKPVSPGYLTADPNPVGQFMGPFTKARRDSESGKTTLTMAKSSIKIV